MKKLIIIIIFICSFFYSVISDANQEDRLLYAQGNFFVWKGVITSFNWRTGKLLPLGTAISIVKKSSKGIVCKIEKTGEIFTFQNPIQSGKNIEEVFSLFFSPDDPKKKLIGVAPEEEESILRAEVKPGMSKTAVLLSLGPPHPVDTPDLKSKTWIYWKNRFTSSKFSIIFNDEDKVVSVSGSVVPMEQVPVEKAAEGEKNNDEPKEDIFFSTCNIHYEKGVVSWVNYLRGPIIPFNSKIKLISKKEDRVEFLVLDSGVKITFKNNQTKSGFDTWSLFKRLFDSNDQSSKFSKLSKMEKKGVEGGEVVNGMSKEAVLMSWCPPPPHGTPSLQSSKWVYWKGRTNRIEVVFDSKGKVDRLEE